jgi:hypothetical protein
VLNQTIVSELFVPLSNHQQELVAGGADFELSGSNYANRLANLQGITASGPGGSTGNSIGTTSAVNTAAQDLLGLAVPTVPTIGALGASPILTASLVRLSPNVLVINVNEAQYHVTSKYCI